MSDVVVSVFTDKWSPIISEDTDVVVSVFTDKWSPNISEDTDNNVRKILENTKNTTKLSYIRELAVIKK